MNNILSLWSELTPIKRFVLIGAFISVFLAVLGLGNLSSSTQGSLLYAGLDSRNAGEVIAALDQLGANYDIRGEAIYVPDEKRDILRMQLASQGLPSASGAGYELLDNLSGFGTTSQMFDVTYWRAKEGELARTILALPHVKAARVHISSADSSAFSRNKKMTSSVTVTAINGGISVAQANAIRHLIASAIGGIDTQDVAVIDSSNGLIGNNTDDLSSTAGSTRGAEIKRNVERLLAARVGQGSAIVEVSLELIRERESITERLIDPQTRVAISSETEGIKESSSNAGGDVTVASNIPDGDAANGGGDNSQSTTNKERINYEVSQTSREVLREPGSIKRLTVAVLIDGVQAPDAEGNAAWEPRSDEELSALRELVATAAGIDESRGDILTLKSLPFQKTPENGSIAQESTMPTLGPINTMVLLQTIAMTIVAIVLGLFVLRPAFMQKKQTTTDSVQNNKEITQTETSDILALTGEVSGANAPYAAGLLTDANQEWAENIDPVARLKRLINERQSESVEILRGWLDKQEEKN